eukprot:scaffold106259_cov21-Tisochrysis_lutea.AAC.1
MLMPSSAILFHDELQVDAWPHNGAHALGSKGPMADENLGSSETAEGQQPRLPIQAVALLISSACLSCSYIGGRLRRQEILYSDWPTVHAYTTSNLVCENSSWQRGISSATEMQQNIGRRIPSQFVCNKGEPHNIPSASACTEVEEVIWGSTLGMRHAQHTLLLFGAEASTTAAQQPSNTGHITVHGLLRPKVIKVLVLNLDLASSIENGCTTQVHGLLKPKASKGPSTVWKVLQGWVYAAALVAPTRTVFKDGCMLLLWWLQHAQHERSQELVFAAAPVTPAGARACVAGIH